MLTSIRYILELKRNLNLFGGASTSKILVLCVKHLGGYFQVKVGAALSIECRAPHISESNLFPNSTRFLPELDWDFFQGEDQGDAHRYCYNRYIKRVNLVFVSTHDMTYSFLRDS